MVYKKILLPRINRTDLASLEKRMKGFGDNSNYVITIDEVEYTSISEVSPNQHRAHEVNLLMKDPFISVNFSDTDSYLIANDDVNETTLGEIIEILTEKQREYLWHGSVLAPLIVTSFVVFLTIMASVNFVLELDEPDKNIFFGLTLFSGFFVVLVTSFLLRVRLHQFSQIILNNERDSFFYRYRKQIGFAILSGMIGAIAGTLLTIIVELILS